MHIYRCIISNDEILCDNDQVLKVEDDVVYCVEGKYITVGNDDYGISANVDEDAAEGATAENGEEGGERVVDIVHVNRLVETSFDKKSYMAYIKQYMKEIKDRVGETDPSRVDAFMAGAQTFVKKVIGRFDEYQFFLGESMNGEGMVILCLWEGEKALFYYFKDGLKAERV